MKNKNCKYLSCRNNLIPKDISQRIFFVTIDFHIIYNKFIIH